MDEKKNPSEGSTVSNQRIRQPIVTICGHVDHGKTSILDALRSTCVQNGEAGGITQKISFTSYPLEQLKKTCPLIESSGIKLTIPGFLLIDTPGHAAFTNLRKRGGSLADLAVLVIDINDGIKPQTAEVIQILKRNKTPFVIAMNKIDNLTAWTIKDSSLKRNIELQPDYVRQIFDEKYMTLIGSLNGHGFDADLFYNITDFTKKIALVPTSARTKEGIAELIMMICGLSQRFLEQKLQLGTEPKGVMLEVKKEKTTNYIEAILHDGELNRTDEIAVANINGEPIITKIRILEEIEPLCAKFKAKEKVTASTGIRMQLVEKDDILPGMPFVKYNGNKKEIEEQFKKEIENTIKTDKTGIIVKADSLGSLEALLVLLRQQNIQVLKAGIGSINKKDIISAKANLDINELDSVILGFNVEPDEEAHELMKAQGSQIKILTNDVVYRLIDDLMIFRKDKRNEIEKQRLMGLCTICKLRILHQYVFRNTKPAIFGVKVEGGKLTSDLNMINDKEEKVGRIKNIQSEQKSVHEATKDMEVCISLPGVNFERELKDKEFLYTDLGETQFRNFKKNKDLLSSDEMQVLKEIAEIKRQTKSEWGM